MLEILISGQLKKVQDLNVSKDEKYQAVALLRQWDDSDRVGREVFWIVCLPKHLVAYAKIKQGKGYSVVVRADAIWVAAGDAKTQYPDAQFVLSAASIHSV